MSDDGFARSTEEGHSDKAEAHRVFVLHQLRAGSQPDEIVQMLVQSQGLGRAQAAYLVESSQAMLLEAVAAEQVTGQALMLGTLGGLLAAALGGTIWALVTAGTNSEFGLIAWGIGGLCGFAVALFARPMRGLALQVSAVITSALGILGGKYGFVYLMVKQATEAEGGAEAAAEISFFSPELVEFFIANAGDWLSGFDLVWIGLAVVTAWSIPKPGGLGSLIKKTAA